MADAVTSQTLVDTSGTKTVMKFTNMSDGSGETLVTKMDASALTFMTEDATKSIATRTPGLCSCDIKIPPAPGNTPAPPSNSLRTREVLP